MILEAETAPNASTNVLMVEKAIKHLMIIKHNHAFAIVLLDMGDNHAWTFFPVMANITVVKIMVL